MWYPDIFISESFIRTNATISNRLLTRVLASIRSSTSYINQNLLYERMLRKICVHSSQFSTNLIIPKALYCKDGIVTNDDVPANPSHSYTPYVSNIFALDEDPPKQVKVVICGAGIVGTSIAYHLSMMGWGSNTVLLEQGKLGGPTSWRGSGFLGGVKLSKPEMHILQSSLNLVKKLDEQKIDVGWNQCGSLHVARTINRYTHFQRMKSIAEARGTECYMLRSNQLQAKCDILNIDDLLGALWVPNDGVCDPYKLCLALLQESRSKGTHITEDCGLKRIITKRNRVVAIETTKGFIECDTFINAGGTWARKVGQMSEPFVKVPIHPAEHYFLYTDPLDRDFSMPAIRDPDGHIYLRKYNGGVLAGTFDKEAKPAFSSGELPDKWHLREQPVDWDHFHEALKEILHRVPVLDSAILNQVHNSGDGFSPDSRWILGLVPENYFVAAGMKSGGSNAALGIGEMLAKWIVDDHPPMDPYELDILRFLPAHNNRKFLADRVTEVPGMHYSISYPFVDFEKGRSLRMSPIFPKLKSVGAVFNQVMGYERPSYFLPVHKQPGGSDKAPFRKAVSGTFGKPSWFEYTAEEYKACRERVGILDYSSFAKFDIWSRGTEVVDALQYLCSNDVDIPIGGICHSGMQNKLGGYENDCSLARISPNQYMMIAPSIQQTRCLTYLRRNLPDDGSVSISDVTSMYTAICLMGPLSRKTLSEVTDVDLSPKVFPFFSYKLIDIGLVKGIRAFNLTHTGELGWVLYIPNEFAVHVYNNLIEAGKKYGLAHVGYYAMRSIRVEKFYAFWGQDLDSTTTPLECGRVFRTKLDKNIDFLGREALELQRTTGVRRLYAHLTLEDHDTEVDNWPCGGEPIYRNGRFVGVTTTTAYGFTLQKIVCLGFIRNVDDKGVHNEVTPDFVMTGEYEVEIAGIRYAANASLRSPSLPSKFADDMHKDRYMATQT